jgi:energy-coupling factor transport system permease protein
VAPFALVIVALNAVLVPGEPMVTLGGHRVASREGFHDGIFFALRLAVMLMAVSVLIAGTAPESLAAGVHDLVRRVSPRAARRVALFVFLSMGFVPLFVDEIARIRMAQSFRGGDFSGGVLRRAGSVRAWLVPLVMSAVHRSGQLALAVELRQIPSRLVRTIEVPRTRAADAVLLLAATVLVIAASWSR